VPDGQLHLLDIEALAVVGDLQQVAVGGLPQGDVDRAGAGVLGNVGQRLLADVEQRQRLGVGDVRQVLIRALQVDRQQGVDAEFLHQPPDALHQVFVVQLARSQVEDVGADVADGVVEVADGLFDALGHAGRVALDQQAGVFQRQPDRVNRLDDAVVQVHADALAFLQHRIDGVLLLDKPAGMTSNAALQKAKWLLNAAKAGHTGTLDPMATGLLPICFGEATKFAGELLGADKRYAATVQLG